jgi:hypothetical protein
VIALPLLAGAVHDTVADPLPRVARTFPGAPGGAVGVTAVEAAENAPVPCALVARTVKVYATPLMRPETVALLAVAPALTTTPPGVEATM